jgi:ribosomal protein S18 acetylase RimI-like enzyme
MAIRYGLNHWNNFYLKNLAIVLMCAMKNNVYLVFDNKTPIATFQTRKCGPAILFQKLATDPDFESRGVGSFCLSEIERIGREWGCSEVVCEVYDKSKHAIRFYEHKGFTVYDTAKTLKFTELKMKKQL